MTLYTPEDLLQYLYKETSTQESIAIEKALSENWALREKFDVIRLSVDSLNSVIESPRVEVILQVLNYARETMVESA
ncbi:MAG: hypothetical protein ABIN89_20630 [Chitinophagaceae bacterium]